MFDYNKDGKFDLSDVWAFLTQKFFGLPVYLLAALGYGVYHFFISPKGRSRRRKLF